VPQPGNVEVPSHMESPSSAPPSREGATSVPSLTPSSRGGRSSSFRFAKDMARVDEECLRPVIPNRKDRRCLDGEKSLGSPPILPVPGEVKHTVILGDGTKVCGWDFQVSLGE